MLSIKKLIYYSTAQTNISSHCDGCEYFTTATFPFDSGNGEVTEVYRPACIFFACEIILHNSQYHLNLQIKKINKIARMNIQKIISGETTPSIEQLLKGK